MCSYRTYEEWKPFKNVFKQIIHNRSYRTYEEWKLRDYRKKYSVDIQFLPYLWGMETYNVKKIHDDMYSSYRTYEEWKLLLGNRQRTTHNQSSYRTYEEWKLSEWVRNRAVT